MIGRSSARALLGLPLLLGLGALLLAQSGQVVPPPRAGTSLPGRVVKPRDLPLVEVPPRAVPLGTEADVLFWKGREAPGPPLELINDLPRDKDDIQPLTPTLSTNFEGIPYTGWIPPDTILAAGPSHVIEMVNSSFRISSKTGTNLFTTTLASWWSGVISGASPFDPKILYDQHSGRWVMLALDTDFTSESWYLLSTSWSSDPTGNWCVWALDADMDGLNPTSNWADFPGLGVDDQAIYLTSNQFSFSGNTFQYAKLRVLAKAQLYNNTCGAVSGWDFVGMTNADASLAFTLQPAHTFGTPGKESLVNSRSWAGSSVTLWSLMNPLGNPPTLTREATVSVGAYSAPPDAEQPGTTTRIDTGDARLLNATYRDGSLYTGHTVTCSTSYSCIRYLRLNVSNFTATLDFAFGATGSYYFYPAMIPDAAGNILTVFSRSSPAEFAGVRHVSWRAGDGTFQPSASLKAGEATYVQLDSLGCNRWGDYSGVALDPTDSRLVWIAGEFADTPANTWGTWIGSVTEPASLSINDVTVTEGDAGTVDAVFTVTLSPTSGSDVTVNFDPADGTATAGADYSSNSGQITITAGASTQTITVQVLGDTTDEPNETFFVNLSNASGAGLGDAQGVGTITDDDPPPGTFKGIVRNAAKQPIAGATIGAYQSAVLKFSATSNAKGKYTLRVSPGTYDLVASKAGFLDKTRPGLAIASSQTLTGINFKLFRPSFFQGTVTDKNTTAPLDGALVEALKKGTVRFSTTTAVDGTYNLQVTKGIYTLRVSRAGYVTRKKKDQTIGDGATKTGVNFALAPAP